METEEKELEKSEVWDKGPTVHAYREGSNFTKTKD